MARKTFFKIVYRSKKKKTPERTIQPSSSYFMYNILYYYRYYYYTYNIMSRCILLKYNIHDGWDGAAHDTRHRRRRQRRQRIYTLGDRAGGQTVYERQ